MDFLVPYTKTLDSVKTEAKFEAPDDTENFSDMKEEDQTAYDHEIIQEEESQNMEEDEEDVVYEAYEIQEQLPSSTASPLNQKSQITLVRSHPNAVQNTSMPQLQPLISSINTITSSSSKPQSQTTLQINTNQISQIAQQQQQQQQQTHTHIQTQQQTIPVQNTIIPIPDDQSSADLNFFLALMPDVKNMSQEQKRKLRIGILSLISTILDGSSPQ